MAANLVVARLKNGTILKGSSLDVDPARPICHIQTVDRGIVPVNLADLKALFFVKDASGDPARKEAVKPSPGDPRLMGGKQIVVEFSDGEVIRGIAHYNPERNGFFLFPHDRSKNDRIFVVNSVIVSIEVEKL